MKRRETLISPLFNHEEKELIFCDYASAQESLTIDTAYRVWLPQPLYRGGLFPKDSASTIQPV